VSDLLKAVRSAAVTTDKDDTGIRLEIGPQSIRLTSSGASGDSEQVVDCHSDGAVSLRVGALFLAQALAALPADQTVTLRAIDPEAAILLELSGIRQIVMPLVTPE
jgi:hypothetical protein